jgi:hypothetical protein
VSEVPFDPRRAAALELEWWIVHREVDDHPPGDLEAALAELAAELYQVPAERLWTHAARRAEAMTIRDRTSRREVGVLDDDWDRIEAVLWVAWKALADEVRDGQEPRPGRPDQPARGQGGHPAPGQVAGDEQQPGDDRDHRRHRGGDGRAEQQEQGRLADPGPGGHDQQQRAAGERGRERARALQPEQRPALGSEGAGQQVDVDAVAEPGDHRPAAGPQDAGGRQRRRHRRPPGHPQGDGHGPVEHGRGDGQGEHGQDQGQPAVAVGRVPAEQRDHRDARPSRPVPTSRSMNTAKAAPEARDGTR